MHPLFKQIYDVIKEQFATTLTRQQTTLESFEISYNQAVQDKLDQMRLSSRSTSATLKTITDLQDNTPQTLTICYDALSLDQLFTVTNPSYG